MSKSEKVLISELPVDKLIEASEQLVNDGHLPMKTTLINASAILNPGGSNHPDNIIFDFDGLKGRLRQYEQSLIGAVENLRERWQRIECECKTRGAVPERTIESIATMKNDAIVDIVLLIVVRQKEIQKLRRKVEEIESRQKETVQRKRRYHGACKRARKDANGIYQISEVDGMKVDEKGIVAELGVHIDEYLEECRKRRKSRNAA